MPFHARLLRRPLLFFAGAIFADACFSIFSFSYATSFSSCAAQMPRRCHTLLPAILLRFLRYFVSISHHSDAAIIFIASHCHAAAGFQIIFFISSLRRCRHFRHAAIAVAMAYFRRHCRHAAAIIFAIADAFDTPLSPLPCLPRHFTPMPMLFIIRFFFIFSFQRCHYSAFAAAAIAIIIDCFHWLPPFRLAIIFCAFAISPPIRRH